jgi:hypothetical protein
MSTTGINGWRFPSYSDSPDVPRDLGVLAEDISAFIEANPGPQGEQGPRGTSVLNGTSNPTSSDGVDGDFYINTTSNAIFGPRAAGAWGSGTAMGGNSVLNGTSDPASEVGSDGDFYINTSSKTIFGPKASGIWTIGTSMVGPTGSTGATGATGAKGDAAATIQVVSTTTSLPGSEAQVTNSGTSSNVLLNFVIPRGQDGAPGEPGAAGAQGAQGPAGTTPSLNPISTIIGLNTTITSSVGVASNWFPLSTNAFSLGIIGPIDGGTSSTTRAWRNIYLNNAATVISDSRTKENIVSSDLGLDFINNLNPVKYTKVDGDRTHYGLIAQEVKQAVDEAGVSDFGGWVISDVNDPDGQQALRYEEFVSPLIKAVQELSARVKALEEA